MVRCRQSVEATRAQERHDHLHIDAADVPPPLSSIPNQVHAVSGKIGLAQHGEADLPTAVATVIPAAAGDLPDARSP